ncbi:lamin tail domain-containing protein, partial [Candidatus Marinimicrobia bacterium]|nr:lamin tail domain-containing protein [Candidatus Neomarinimicrobiota bacterium]
MGLFSYDGPEPCILGDVYVSEGHTSGDPEDYIELYNSGDEDCSLKGFQLDDSEELDDLTFGDVIIPAGGYWLGYEDADSSFSSGLSGSGDLIVFADSTGSSLIVELNQTEEMDGISLSQSFDADGNGCYTSPTPGLMNGECVTLSLGHNSSIPVDYS